MAPYQAYDWILFLKNGLLFYRWADLLKGCVCLQLQRYHTSHHSGCWTVKRKRYPTKERQRLNFHVGDLFCLDLSFESSVLWASWIPSLGCRWRGDNNFYFKVVLKMEVKYNKSCRGMSYVGQRVMQKLLGMVVPEVRTAVLLLLLMWVMETEQEGAKGDEVEGAGVRGRKEKLPTFLSPMGPTT